MIQVLGGWLGIKVVDTSVGQQGCDDPWKRLVILGFPLDDDSGLPDHAL